jgi:hypothetical protein
VSFCGEKRSYRSNEGYLGFLGHFLQKQIEGTAAYYQEVRIPILLLRWTDGLLTAYAYVFRPVETSVSIA